MGNQCAQFEIFGSHATWDQTQCYMPPGRGDIPAFTPAIKAGRPTRGGMQGGAE